MLNKKWDDVINYMGQLMKISPLKIEELICLGIAYQHLKDYHMALHYFYVASLIEPDNYLSYLAQANFHGLLKKEILSQVNYKKAMNLTDKDYIILLNQANLKLSRKNYPASYKLLSQASQISDNKKLIYQELARYFLIIDNQKKAYSFINESFNLGNRSPALFMLINHFENKYKIQFPPDIINSVEKEWKTWYNTLPEYVLLFHLQYKFLP